MSSRESDEWSHCGEISSSYRKKQHSLQSYSTDDSFESFTSELPTVTRKYQTAPSVPTWTIRDVMDWVESIDFQEYRDRFCQQMVDGDILLMLSEEDLKNEIGMRSGLHRTRFMRSLHTLKLEADYSEADKTDLNGFLKDLSPELSCYTYRMLARGIDRGSVWSLTDKILETDIQMTNSIHRLKILQAIRPEEVAAVLAKSRPLGALSKEKYDLFISYRRDSGAHLAALIRLVLELRGYRVYFDIDEPNPGKFDSSFLENVLNSKHIVVVLSPNSLDNVNEDLLHKELRCAFDHQKNVIPIFDPGFEFPEESLIPMDICLITELNGISWIEEYQDACVSKCIKFIEGNLNKEIVIEKYNLTCGNRKHVHFSDPTHKINALERELQKMRSELSEAHKKLEAERRKNSGPSPRRTPIFSSDGSFDFYSDNSS
ncbi:hypothetical protein CAEBREN_21367 [Caenorhabditis brenneri]|uniref:Sterile alpha and TIR motif-containing protein 1 n=1 Tax=Caenorhabditis brenneri TaxID=135651 RepID=G0MBZ1_CAEBE|nr:hypothetical protein CAEBREN_21367 [Caenorhabditis brenneri]